MKKNIAIIIGISKYDNLTSLPGCKNDLKLISEIICKTKKYEDVLTIDENLSAMLVKEKINEFIVSQQDEEINEIFFYYSGHGTFDGEDLRYIFSDYCKEKFNATTITNEFIDDLFRNLNPKLLIKVVDACQSGVPYIKGDNNGDISSLYANKKSLNNCYFMYSSHTNQSSYVDKLSHFTKSFVDAILKHTGKSISYTNIIDYIKDDFNNNNRQTPYFITQGSLTEIFCEVTPEIKEINIEGYMQLEKEPKDEKSLIEAIKKEAKNYLDRECVNEFLISMKGEMLSRIKEWKYKEIYELQLSINDKYEDILAMKKIAKWVNANKDDFLVNVIKEKISYDASEGESGIQTLATSMLAIQSLLGSRYEPAYIVSELEIPYNTIHIDLKTKYPNLMPYRVDVVFLVSRHNIAVIYNFTSYKESGWDTYQVDVVGEINVLCYEYSQREECMQGVKNIIDELEKYIYEKLNKKYNLVEQA